MRTFLMLSFAVNAMLLYHATAQLTPAVSQPEPTCLMQLPNFPLSSPLFKQDFENFGRTVHVENLWKVVARTPDDVVIFANWAFQNNYTIRPLGKMHNWSPLTVTQASNCGNTLLVDTTQYLTGIEILPNGIENYTFPVVKAQSGVLLGDLLAELEDWGFGFTGCPAFGNITIGGVFAIAGHGSAVKVANSTKHLKNYGTVVNRIVKIEAVAWNKESQSYSLQTFDRSMNEVSALMTHVGLAFITSITLRVEENFKLRCIIHTEIPNSEVFANPADGQNARTYASFLENSGRVVSVPLIYVNYSWVLHCSDVETCPPESKQAHEPHSYGPLGVRNLLKDLPAALSNFSNIDLGFSIFNRRLLANSNRDACGLSKNMLLYLDSETPRTKPFSYAVLTKRQNVQQIVYMMKNKIDSMHLTYQQKLTFPAMEIRTTGLDDPNDIGPEAQNSFLAMTTPPKQYPEFDVAVWVEFLPSDGTPDTYKFLQEIESYIISTFNGTLGLSRPEWSKGWAVTQSGTWTNTSVMHDVIVNRYDQWDEFVKVCNDLDPHKIFRNEFLNQLFI